MDRGNGLKKKKIQGSQYNVINVRAMGLGSEDLPSNSSSATDELANFEQISTSQSLNSLIYKVKGLDYTQITF